MHGPDGPDTGLGRWRQAWLNNEILHPNKNYKVET